MYKNLGSVAQVTSENGLALQEYLYTPYGEAYNTEYDSVNGLRFVGRYGGYTDDDTRLTYFWHRWYDSADGRWVSRDPIGVAGGVNLYNYVDNATINYIDFNGLLKYLPGNIYLPYGDGTCMYPIPMWHFLIPTYGNYCGPSYSKGRRIVLPEETNFNIAPKNGLDLCCKKHDECAEKVRDGDRCTTMKDCDKSLSKCMLQNVLTNPLYAGFGLIYFGIVGIGGN